MNEAAELRLARMEERQLAQGALLLRLEAAQDALSKDVQGIREARAVEAATVRGAILGGRLAAGIIGGVGGAAVLRGLELLSRHLG